MHSTWMSKDWRQSPGAMKPSRDGSGRGVGISATSTAMSTTEFRTYKK